MPQLDGGEVAKTVVHVLLGRFQEDPRRHPVTLAAYEVYPAPHGRELAVRTRLDEDVPPVVAAPELAHVLGVFAAWKGSGHTGSPAPTPAPGDRGMMVTSDYSTLPVAFLPVRFRHA